MAPRMLRLEFPEQAAIIRTELQIRLRNQIVEQARARLAPVSPVRRAIVEIKGRMRRTNSAHIDSSLVARQAATSSSGDNDLWSRGRVLLAMG